MKIKTNKLGKIFGELTVFCAQENYIKSYKRHFLWWSIYFIVPDPLPVPTCLSLSCGILASTPSGKGFTSSGFSLIFSMMKSSTTMMPSTDPVMRHARSVVPAERHFTLSISMGTEPRNAVFR